MIVDLHELRPYQHPLQGGAQNARMAWESRSGVIIVLSDERGQLGFGEAAPLPGRSPEALSEVVESIRRVPWPVELDEAEPPIVMAAHLSSALDEGAGGSGRFGVETAGLDLRGRRAGRSLVDLLGGPARPKQATARLLDRIDSAALDALLDELGAREALTLKLKIGRRDRFEDELAAMRRLRTHFGSRLTLRLDANLGLPEAELRDRLDRIAELEPELIEDPCEVDRLRVLSECPVPIALDEPVRSAEDLDRLRPLLERSFLRALVLKPSVLGSFSEIMRTARGASALGLDLIISHLFEGPVAHAAAAALSLTLPNATRAAGLGPHAGLVGDRASWPHLRADELVPPSKPGIGFVPSEAGR